jgi:hypothetical protein
VSVPTEPDLSWLTPEALHDSTHGPEQHRLADCPHQAHWARKSARFREQVLAAARASGVPTEPGTCDGLHGDEVDCAWCRKYRGVPTEPGAPVYSPEWTRQQNEALASQPVPTEPGARPRRGVTTVRYDPENDPALAPLPTEPGAPDPFGDDRPLLESLLDAAVPTEPGAPDPDATTSNRLTLDPNAPPLGLTLASRPVPAPEPDSTLTFVARGNPPRPVLVGISPHPAKAPDSDRG